jgi:hypothetical protein
MNDYWVNGTQVTGFIGALLVIFGIFLPLFAVNVPVLGPIPVSLISIPFVGVPLGCLFIILALISILALAAAEYRLLLASGAVTLFLVLGLFFFSSLGLMVITGNLPGVVSAAIDNLIDYDFGWIVMVAGAGFQIMAPVFRER